MKKILCLLAAILLVGVVLYSCTSSSDDYYKVDEKWKAFNEKVYGEIADSTEFIRLPSRTGNGNLYYKTTNRLKITIGGTPYITDSVVCRYEGWYYYIDDNGERQKEIFDSTEGDANAQDGRGFRLNTLVLEGGVMGWADMLQEMKVGEEVEVCMPYNLAYGLYGSSSIPGATTLFFTIKLLKIVASNEGEFD